MKIFILFLALGLCLTASVPGGYQQVNTAEAQADPTVQGYIQAGLNAIVGDAINKGYISNSNSNFTLAQLYSVAEQVVNGVNYQFYANFTNGQGVDILANFTVNHSASDNTTTVTSFNYKIYYPATTTTTTTVTSTAPSNATTVTETEAEGVVEDNSSEAVAVEENAILVPTEGIIASEGDTVFDIPVIVNIPEEAVPVSVAEAGEAGEAIIVSPSEEAVIVTPSEEAAIETSEAAPATEESTTEATPAPVVTADGFTVISAADFAQDEDLQKEFQYGFQTVVQNGINAGKIPNTTFSSSNVLSVGEKAVKNGILYKFAAQASNGNGVNLDLVFNVLHSVPSYSYTATITTPSNNTGTNSTSPPVVVTPPSNNTNTTTPPVIVIPPVNTTVPSNSTNTTAPSNTTSVEWVPVDLGRVQQNAEINSSLVNGFNQVIQTAIQKGALQNDNYTITQVVAASQHNLTNGVNYKFTVLAQNAAATTFLNMTYTTYYRYSNQSVKTVAYQYTYSIKGIPTPPAQNNTNTTTPPVVVTPPTNNTNTTVPPVIVTPPVNSTNTTTPPVIVTPPTNNTNTTTPPVVIPPVNSTNNTNTTAPTNNGYVALSNDQIQAQDVQNALTFGSNQVVSKGQQSNKIPAGTYNLTQVASVFKKVQPTGANYNATVTLTNGANVTVNANFNVFSDPSSNTQILKAFSYSVSGIKKL